MEELTKDIALRKAFYELELKYRPFFDFLMAHQDEYPEFKGALTIDGYLNYNPDLLVLGLNPAHGPYREWEKHFPLVYMGERPFELFKSWNSRKGAWWEMDKPVNNTYPANTIEFFYTLQSELGIDPEYGTNKKPSWYNDSFEKSIMTMNLYPIATENGKKLRVLFDRMVKESAIPEIAGRVDEWDVRRLFVHLMHQFIEIYVNPKVIVCLGSQTMSDYCWGAFEVDSDGILESAKYPNVIGIRRSGTWSKRAKKAAKKVASILKETEKCKTSQQ